MEILLILEFPLTVGRDGNLMFSIFFLSLQKKLWHSVSWQKSLSKWWTTSAPSNCNLLRILLQSEWAEWRSWDFMPSWCTYRLESFLRYFYICTYAHLCSKVCVSFFLQNSLPRVSSEGQNCNCFSIQCMFMG